MHSCQDHNWSESAGSRAGLSEVTLNIVMVRDETFLAIGSRYFMAHGSKPKYPDSFLTMLLFWATLSKEPMLCIPFRKRLDVYAMKQ